MTLMRARTTATDPLAHTMCRWSGECPSDRNRRYSNRETASFITKANRHFALGPLRPTVDRQNRALIAILQIVLKFAAFRRFEGG